MACHRHAHPELRFSVASTGVPAADVRWLLDYLERSVAAGTRYKPGETLKVGWMLLEIAAAPDGKLALSEPDMRAIPIVFTPFVDNTLTQLRAQRATVDSVLPAAAPVFPALHQTAIVHRHYKSAKRILLSRAAGKGNDSGWWLSDLDDAEGNRQPQNFLKMSLYQLAVDRPDLVKFFALPPDYQAVVDGRVGVLHGGAALAFKPESFLALLNEHQSRV